jgi:hypothetical protein
LYNENGTKVIGPDPLKIAVLTYAYRNSDRPTKSMQWNNTEYIRDTVGLKRRSLLLKAMYVIKRNKYEASKYHEH